MISKASIPVDLFNPGQVFACLGFLEAADLLLGEAEGGFDWSDEADVRFHMQAAGNENPFSAVLQFLAEAEVRRCVPIGYKEPPPKGTKKPPKDDGEGEGEQDWGVAIAASCFSDTFPCSEADRMALPIRLEHDRLTVDLGHWIDGSSRNDFTEDHGTTSAESVDPALDHVDLHR